MLGGDRCEVPSDLTPAGNTNRRRPVGSRASNGCPACGFRTSFGTLRDVVGRSRSAEDRGSGRRSSRLAGTSSDGETRTRTGDTTIFRESSRAIRGQERPANLAVCGIGALIKCPRIGAVSCRFGTSSGPRSPNHPWLRCRLSLARGPCGWDAVSGSRLVAAVQHLAVQGDVTRRSTAPFSGLILTCSKSSRRSYRPAFSLAATRRSSSLARPGLPVPLTCGPI
jgi:hypothetical protein